MPSNLSNRSESKRLDTIYETTEASLESTKVQPTAQTNPWEAFHDNPGNNFPADFVRSREPSSNEPVKQDTLSILGRLENEDVEDMTSTITHFGSSFNEVAVKELSQMCAQTCTFCTLEQRED